MTTRTYTVYLNEGPGMFRDYDPDTAVLVYAGSYTLDGDVDLDAVYRFANIGGPEDPNARRYRNVYRARSLSVGDVIAVGETFHSVAAFGFTQHDAADWPSDGRQVIVLDDPADRDARDEQVVRAMDVIDRAGHLDGWGRGLRDQLRSELAA